MSAFLLLKPELNVRAPVNVVFCATYPRHELVLKVNLMPVDWTGDKYSTPTGRVFVVYLFFDKHQVSG